MSKTRFTERKKEVAKANSRFLESLEEPKNDITRDAVIQRFEFTVELIWKTLKLYLERQGVEVGGPRQTLKKAFGEGIIKSTKEADLWFKILEDRNLTRHTYHEELAKAIAGRIRRSYAKAIQEMSKRIQKLNWD